MPIVVFCVMTTALLLSSVFAEYTARCTFAVMPLEILS